MWSQNDIIHQNLPGDLWRHCGGLGKEILMPYPINQSWREQIELNWIGARVGLWDKALKFLSPGPRNDVTDHLVDFLKVLRVSFLIPVVGPSARSRSLAHFATENIKIQSSSRFALEKKKIWAQLVGKSN